MSRGIWLRLNLKDAYIIKHALRDKADKDEAEQKVYEYVCDIINAFKDWKRIK